jgi:hypothetical protein
MEHYPLKKNPHTGNAKPSSRKRYYCAYIMSELLEIRAGIVLSWELLGNIPDHGILSL